MAHLHRRDHVEAMDHCRVGREKAGGRQEVITVSAREVNSKAGLSNGMHRKVRKVVRRTSGRRRRQR